jgi:hypothetical protein
MEHKRGGGGDEAYRIVHRGAHSRGYKRRKRARARERGFGLEVRRLSLPPPCLSCSACLCSSSPCVRAPCLRKALDVPLYRYKEMAQLYNEGVAIC